MFFLGGCTLCVCWVVYLTVIGARPVFCVWISVTVARAESHYNITYMSYIVYMDVLYEILTTNVLLVHLTLCNVGKDHTIKFMSYSCGFTISHISL